jgi:hypothetical protein
MFLILILIIVLVYIFFKPRLEGFEEDTTTKDKKALLCFYGGAFREGNIGTTKVDSEYGYKAQKNTSITHAKLKEVLNKKGYQTDVLINTRSTKYKSQLESWYDPYNMIVNKLSDKFHGRDYMIQSTINNINKLNKYEYDFILFVRIDLFLKPEFYKVLDTEINKISFIANNYDTNTCLTKYKNDPVIVDLFVLIPKKYYFILDKRFQLNHNAWTYYKKQYKLTDDDMTFISDKIFDSNSYREINPYYLMSSRKENKNTHKDPGKKCKGYSEKEQRYLDNPTNYYIEKHKHFYLSK